ncbi:MAG: class I SAM-dependent methyltransferase [Solirubrobacterales bacterium]
MGEKKRLNEFFDWYYNDFADYSPERGMPLLRVLPYFIHRKMMERIMLTHLIKHEIPSLSDLKIADIGCGDGSRFRPFIEWGARSENVYAIDISERVLTTAKQKSPADVNFICAFGDNLPLDDASMDILLNMGVIIHVMEDELVGRMAAEFYRVLKPGGIFFLYYTTERLSLDGSLIAHSTRGYRREQIMELFKGFETIAIHSGFVDNPLDLTWEKDPIYPFHIGKVEDFLMFKDVALLHELIVFKKPNNV